MEERPLVIGKGTAWELKPGVYQYRHNLGRNPVTGKYQYSSKRTIHTKKKSEVTAALEAFKVELNEGAVSKLTEITVGEYSQKFHELRDGTMNSPLAYKRERLDVKHINELFGNYRLRLLKAPIIKQAYADARKTNRFSDNELNKIHMKLKQILSEAVKDELILKNPCLGISVPRPAPEERSALTIEEAGRLRDSLLAANVGANIIGTLLLLDTGMRRGEMLGLTWKHISFENNTVQIAQQFASDKKLRPPKSKMSRRRIFLSEDLLEHLLAWRDLQAALLEPAGVTQTLATPVVNNDLGDFCDPDNYSRWFRNFCVDNKFGVFGTVTKTFTKDGIEYTRGKGYVGLSPHMLRHTHATVLISANMDIKTVQTRLGHSSSSLTLNTYSHAVAANDKIAAESFSSLLRKS